MKKALIIRYGAFGDALIISPVIQELYKQGYEIVLNCNSRTYEIYEHDNRISRFIRHQEDMPVSELEKHWEKLKEEESPDKYINFTGSIEQKLAVHPTQPEYIYPKFERQSLLDKNYYYETAIFAGLDLPVGRLRPSMFFTEQEHEKVKSYIKKDRFNVLWCLSGSGSNKVFPWTEFIMGSIIKEYPDVNFITVGGVTCKLLENVLKELPEENFTELSGDIPIRLSMLLTKYVDCVISPDTGVLHGSGMFDTPKIGLLGHTSIENITKTFLNDYSIEAECECAPCFRLIYDHSIQCPVDCVTGASWCMSHGISPERVFNQFKKVREEHK